MYTGGLVILAVFNTVIVYLLLAEVGRITSLLRKIEGELEVLNSVSEAIEANTSNLNPLIRQK